MTADLTQVDTVTVTTTGAARLILSSSTEPVHSEDTFSKETTVASSTALSRASSSVIVLGNTSVVISGLRPFEEFFIEVVYSVMHQSSNG